MTYTYNGAEQMTSSTMGGKTTTYTYAGADQNELLSQTTPGGDSYTYVYGKSGQLQSQTSSGLTSFFFDDPTTGQVLDAVSPDLQVGLYLVDGIGNPVGVLSDDGQRAYTVSFDPYGNRTVVSGGASPWFEYLPFGYKSGIRITGDGLVKFGLRWYLPVAGGWTQEDTLDPSTPATRNVTRMLGTIRSIIRTRTGASTRATTPHPSTQGLQSSPEVCSDLWEQRTAAFSVERLASRLVAM
ncbi:hypothetical protein DEI92_07585 [Curtobacterium sp. MCBD17_034]|nr:hypothetical protein DEI92_07585 [Curtobacterium sp. MCBD17_034]PZM34906.1 hypothetical protein DEI90_05570 [Curtobacterium sp. MCBD17_031]